MSDIQLIYKVCNNIFHNIVDFKEHKMKPYSCQICDQSFTISGQLTSHQKKHTQGSWISCDTCKLTFSKTKNLETHNKIYHSGRNRPNCKLCKKSYTSNRDQKLHIISHTGEKPYLCTECPKPVRLPNHLKEHLVLFLDKNHIPALCVRNVSQRHYKKIHNSTMRYRNPRKVYL